MISKIKLLILCIISFNCASSQYLEENPPAEVGKVYMQHWHAGVRDGGYGFNVFIPVKENIILLDSIYFRDKVTKLTNNKSPKLYIGRFTIKPKSKRAIILSDNLDDEFNKQIKRKTQPFSFQLKPNECVISYFKKEKKGYFKVNNIIEKPTLNYP